MQGLSAPRAAPQESPNFKSDATNRLVNDARQAVAEAHKPVVEARAQLAAAAKSGDPQATQLYAQRLQQLVSARDKLAAERLGNGAAAFIATLGE